MNQGHDENANIYISIVYEEYTNGHTINNLVTTDINEAYLLAIKLKENASPWIRFVYIDLWHNGILLWNNINCRIVKLEDIQNIIYGGKLK